MSVMSYTYEERLCRICGGYDKEYARDSGRGHRVLFATSIRRYAHAQCLVEKHGKKAALAMIRHDWMKREFLRSLRFPISKDGKHPLEKQFEAMRGRKA
jgi:hypothetical protein